LLAVAILSATGGGSPLPYGYFTFLRIVVCLTAGCLAAVSFRDGKSLSATIFALVAVLFNPFVPIKMEKSDWLFFDLVTVVIFIPHAIFCRLDGSGYVKRAFWRVGHILSYPLRQGHVLLSRVKHKSENCQIEMPERREETEIEDEVTRSANLSILRYTKIEDEKTALGLESKSSSRRNRNFVDSLSVRTFFYKWIWATAIALNFGQFLLMWFVVSTTTRFRGNLFCLLWVWSAFPGLYSIADVPIKHTPVTVQREHPSPEEIYSFLSAVFCYEKCNAVQAECLRLQLADEPCDYNNKMCKRACGEEKEMTAQPGGRSGFLRHGQAFSS
jgi:hypothetical protein